VTSPLCRALPREASLFLMASSDTGASASLTEAAAAAPVAEMASLTVEGQPPAGEFPSVAEGDKANEEAIPPHRSHDPATNLKRTDPFQFGSRYLTEEDNVFEFNAWDHVETDDAYKEYAEQQFEKQRQSPVSDFDKSESFPMLLPLSFTATLVFPVT
jgi:tRNAThr (cytosine32-N3)-methyltransferase